MFYTKNIKNAVLQKKKKKTGRKGFEQETHFFRSKDVLLSVEYLIFSGSCLLHLKHVSLRFNVYH